MKNINEEINIKIGKIETLEESFDKAYQDETFKQIVTPLGLPKKEIIKYTSRLEESSEDIKRCNQCKSILECENKITGYAYLPRIREERLEFEYTACKYLKELEKERDYLKNITFFKGSEKLKEAKMKDIHMEDKNRYETIKWLKNFIEKYPKNHKIKGLYLYGNFGCGKSYLITAMFAEMAKKGVKSTIIFWPEFLRDLKASFGTDYEQKYHHVKKTPLLLIDDIGAESTTEWARDEIFCPLVQYRMDEGLPTFFTSNLDLNLLEEHFSCSKKGIDAVKARRIIERIKQLTEPIQMLSRNKRG